MTPPENINRLTRTEWRELGFFYDFDEAHARWRLVGSRNGLFKFRDLLLAYTNDSRNQSLAEHEHYGPYNYLTIRTWSETNISADGIEGTLDDLKRLAQLVEEKLQMISDGSTFILSTEFASNSAAILQFEVREDSFDPASADPLLQ
jgi:hypothetical protein